MKTLKEVTAFLSEGVYDPGIFKAFFLAGGPGSGKTFVTSQAFAGTGLKIVNSDTIFERGLLKANLSLKMPDEEEYFRNIVRAKAKLTAGSALDQYVKGRLGLVIDATGRDKTVIGRQHSMLSALGYDCYMIFVNTSLEVAMERNKTRSRSIPEYIVKNSWNKVQQNIGSFQHMFRASNMLIIDNNRSEAELVSNTIRTASSYIRRQIRTNPNNYIAKQWIAKELEAKKRI
nr:Predicted kinase (COG4639) [uncultured Mediterranean phage uvMED]|tara:strand:+ start:5333 stop:6025 length:693 start_codon:yes stop_codon:yes gene_type:complete